MKHHRFKLAVALVAAVTAAQPPAAAFAQSSGGSITIESDRLGVTRYVVRRGDTLSSIARSASVPLAVILALNPRAIGSSIKVGDVIMVPGRNAPVGRESVSVEPGRGPADTEVVITGRGFRPDTSIQLLAGRGPYHLEIYERLRTDSSGRVRIRTELPEWARPGHEVYFALQTRDLRSRAVAEPFRVTGRARPSDRITTTGTITRRGVECPLLRGDDGKNYSLAGGLEGFRPGDRVTVEGRLAEMSNCMQGTTINIRRISEAD